MEILAEHFVTFLRKVVEHLKARLKARLTAAVATASDSETLLLIFT